MLNTSASRLVPLALSIWPVISLAGGGPNPFEGSSLITLWLLPALGFLAALLVMLITRGVKLALGSAVLLGLAFIALTLSIDAGILIALLAGPWIAFIWMGITLAIHLLFLWRKGSASASSTA
jgi:hypothetical protein